MKQQKFYLKKVKENNKVFENTVDGLRVIVIKRGRKNNNIEGKKRTKTVEETCIKTEILTIVYS